MRHQNRISVVVLVALLLLVGCQSVQQQWNKLTPDEQARIVVGGFQNELAILFDQGKTFVLQHPEYQDKWKTEIIPSFNVANTAVSSYIGLMASGKIDLTDVVAKVTPLINAIKKLLIGIGVKVPNIAGVGGA